MSATPGRRGRKRRAGDPDDRFHLAEAGGTDGPGGREVPLASLTHERYASK